MRIGMIGLGRMGGNMVTRLVRGGHEVVAYTRDQAKVQKAIEEGALGAKDLEDLVQQLPTPRAIWIMVPAGQATQDMIDRLVPRISLGDVLIDGGNSKFRDDIVRAEALKGKGIHFMDAGTSGGVWGLQVGYCLMVGGEKNDFERLEPIFKTLAPPEGYLHCGPVGAGHFVKMVHNGIEYGMMQAYAEGLNILRHANAGLHARTIDAETTPLRNPEHYQYELNLTDITEVWRRGSVVASWLLDLTASALPA